MKTYGLIGKKLGHSFSQKYFTEKFHIEEIPARYELFEIPDISHFPLLVSHNNFSGLNVTIPYKEAIIPFLDEMDPVAEIIGAVNTIQFIPCKERVKLKGFNTDLIGFKNSFVPLLQPHHKKALILGTGGVSKAVAYVLSSLNIEYRFVSRRLAENEYSYQQLNKEIIEEHTIIINCTPVGTFPEIDVAPGIPYQYLTPQHLLYDLVYNPDVTLFCKLGKEHGATVKNGLDMLYGQAAAAWAIWNS
jgi:shikimate dehydrogenase